MTLRIHLLSSVLLILISARIAVEGATLFSDDIRSRYLNRNSFPQGFIFGTASSAYQLYEGAANVDGRGPSIWDTYTHNYPDKIVDRSNGDVTIDQYHRYKEDVEIMREMNMDSYRFSISWVQDTSKNDFRDYAELCFKEFGDRIKYWVTLNEPWTFSKYGYADGISAPGRCSPWQNKDCTGGDSAIEPYIVTHNQLLAHAAAFNVYKTKYKASQKGIIGISLPCHWIVPLYDTELDRHAAQRALDFIFGWFMEPLTIGEYPNSMQSLVGSRLPKFSAYQISLVRGSFDFIGLNYYTSYYATDAPESSKARPSYLTDSHVILTSERNGTPIGQKTTSKWLLVCPKGIHELLLYIKTKYNNPLIYITENGIDEFNDPSLLLEEALSDTSRIDYYYEHLCYLQRAIKDGVNVKGYFAWSLIDSYEWTLGYISRFGTIFVDYNSLKRYPKLSATWFRNFLRRKIDTYDDMC